MSYLGRYDATPDDQKWPLVRRWMFTEATPFFRELRRYQPILVTPQCTLVARYADVVDCLTYPEVFTVDLYKPKMGTYMLAQDDTPQHFREKAIMRSMLSRDELPRIRALIGETTAEILGEAGGAIEAIGALTRAVPIALVMRYFGLSPIDPQDLARWSYWSQYDTFHNQPFDLEARADEIRAKSDEVAAEMSNFVAELLGRKIAALQAGQARDDVVTRMLMTQYPEAVGFGPERLALNVLGLLIGAVETTSQAVVQALAELLRRPTYLAEAKRAAARGDVETFDRYAFEALRFWPIAPYLFRKTARDYTLAKGTRRQTTLPAGTTVLALVQSAMFDDDVFPLAEEFDVHRPLERMFHLGWGLHECLGKHIGLVMIPEILRHLVLLDDLREAAPIDFAGGPFPERWELRWTPASADAE